MVISAGLLLGPITLALTIVVGSLFPGLFDGEYANAVEFTAPVVLLLGLWSILPYLIGARLRSWWWPLACLVLPLLETIAVVVVWLGVLDPEAAAIGPGILAGPVFAVVAVAAAAVGTWRGTRRR